jgi:hypothetical protein
MRSPVALMFSYAASGPPTLRAGTHIEDRNTNFKEHSIFQSEVADSILAGNDKVLSIPGVREIIAMYLLIPYMTNDQLDVGTPSKPPQLDISEEITSGVNLKNLRDAICHSFVTVEESSKGMLGRIIIDDRAQMNRRAHDKQTTTTQCVSMDILELHNKLKKLHEKLIKSIE